MKGLEQLLPFVLIAVAFWLLLIRPQRRKQTQLANTQRGVQLGDEVLLGSGIVGVVASAEDDYLHLEISPGVRMKVARQAVVRVLQEQAAQATEPATDPATDPATGPATGPAPSTHSTDSTELSPDVDHPDLTGPDDETPPATRGA